MNLTWAGSNEGKVEIKLTNKERELLETIILDKIERIEAKINFLENTKTDRRFYEYLFYDLDVLKKLKKKLEEIK